MQCLCGYSYIEARLEGTDGFESFAVVRDTEYRKFLKREMKVMHAKGKKAKLKALAKSAEFVGAAEVCPECGLLRFGPAGEEEVIFYRRVRCENSPGDPSETPSRGRESS